MSCFSYHNGIFAIGSPRLTELRELSQRLSVSDCCNDVGIQGAIIRPIIQGPISHKDLNIEDPDTRKI